MSKFNIGDKVRYIGDDHNNAPKFYPSRGTIGIIINQSNECNNVYVQWEKGSTSKKDCWYCDKNDIELVENEDMTNEEIWKMLRPKFNKNNLEGNYIRIDRYGYIKEDAYNAIALAYRSGYERAMKGRPFKIGEKKVEEKKQGGHWEPIKENQTIPLKGRVRYSRHDKTADDFQIPIGATGEIRLIDALDHSTMLFTVYLDKMIESTYIQWVVGVPAHCYDMWVEDDE